MGFGPASVRLNIETTGAPLPLTVTGDRITLPVERHVCVEATRHRSRQPLHLDVAKHDLALRIMGLKRKRPGSESPFELLGKR